MNITRNNSTLDCIKEKSTIEEEEKKRKLYTITLNKILLMFIYEMDIETLVFTRYILNRCLKYITRLKEIKSSLYRA